MKNKAIYILTWVFLFITLGCMKGDSTSGTFVTSGHPVSPGHPSNPENPPLLSQDVLGSLSTSSESLTVDQGISDCPVDQVSTVDSTGATVTTSIDELCTIALNMEIEKAYVINFLNEDKFVATLISDNQTDSFSSSVLVAGNSGEDINLGRIDITGQVALPENLFCQQNDLDQDGTNDCEDPDDDDDGVTDEEEPDCDLDGFIDDVDEDSNCQDLIDAGQEGNEVGTEEVWGDRIIEVKPRNGEEEVEAYRRARARFSCDLDRLTVTNETFRVFSEYDTIDCTYRFGNEESDVSRVNCSHEKQPFLPGTTYTAVIGGVACLDGQVLEETSWSWTTDVENDDKRSEEDQLDNQHGEDMVEFVAFGDQGTGNRYQVNVGQAMARKCKSNGCDFAITLGDNFYNHGVTSIDDPLFQTAFEEPYANLNLIFYPAVGNHDADGNLQAQIDYSNVSRKWFLPALYYSHAQPADAPLVEFFAINTENFDKEQRAWLIDAISSSEADWKIIYGHRPFYSSRLDRGGDNESSYLSDPALCGKVDLLISGHIHTKQHRLGTTGNCQYHQVILGSGGQGLYSNLIDAGSFFNALTYGFGWFQVTKDEIYFEFVDIAGTVEYSYTLTR